MSDIMNNTPLAMSSLVPRRRIGITSVSLPSVSPGFRVEALFGVAIEPGATAFTRMLRLPHSMESDRVSESTAALAAA